jgi:hypothetical protein
VRFATMEGCLQGFRASFFDRGFLVPCSGVTSVVVPCTVPSSLIQNDLVKKKLSLDGRRFDGTEALISIFVGGK